MLKALVIDDEAPARRRLKKLLEPFVADDRLVVIGEAGDGVEAVEQITSQQPDLVFLDIRMPGLDGFEVIERLDEATRPIVVFTTAYDEYALQAFKAHAIDYLEKPIDRERLANAIERAERLHRDPAPRTGSDDRINALLDWMESQSDEKATSTHTENEARPTYLKQFSIPYRDRILIIPIDQIVSIEIIDSITRVHLVDDKAPQGRPRLRQHIVNHTLDQLEGQLDPEAFMRVHRSAIINLDHIREMIPWFSGRFKVVLTGDHEVVASRERTKLLKDRLMI